MQFTGERVIEGSTPERIWLDHIARYTFAGRYVKNNVVLDISCGTGYGSKILCDGRAKKVIGIDISKEAIDFALTKYKINGLEFKVGNIFNIDFPDNYFDVITCFETIEHIESPAKALIELQRVLKPQGLLIISSPNRKITSPNKSINEKPNNCFHMIEYTTEEFVYLLSSNFVVLEYFGQRPISKLIFLPILRSILRRIFSQLYVPDRGSARIHRLSHLYEYRYITLVCMKRRTSK